MLHSFKIFEEGNEGPVTLEKQMNDFFSKLDVEIISVNVAVEKVEGIDYKSVVVCYRK